MFVDESSRTAFDGFEKSIFCEKIMRAERLAGVFLVVHGVSAVWNTHWL
jgi:hypothetical protein